MLMYKRVTRKGSINEENKWWYKWLIESNDDVSYNYDKECRRLLYIYI